MFLCVATADWAPSGVDCQNWETERGKLEKYKAGRPGQSVISLRLDNWLPLPPANKPQVVNPSYDVERERKAQNINTLDFTINRRVKKYLYNYFKPGSYSFTPFVLGKSGNLTFICFQLNFLIWRRRRVTSWLNTVTLYIYLLLYNTDLYSTYIYDHKYWYFHQK